MFGGALTIVRPAAVASAWSHTHALLALLALLALPPASPVDATGSLDELHAVTKRVVIARVAKEKVRMMER
ncbi:MAG: hypothetical protein JWP87_5346 [Labilithrix sp.]|nr:hypothetical protein [Labilithrix sp.]